MDVVKHVAAARLERFDVPPHVLAHRSWVGLGQHMFEFAIGEARSRGCSLVQLTSDKTRDDAHRFYDRLGFVASHVGYKLKLD